MLVVCVINEGFSDLTRGKVYEVINEYEYGYEIVDDGGDLWYYMKQLFVVMIDNK